MLLLSIPDVEQLQMEMPLDRLVRAVARLRRQKARRWPQSVRRAVVKHAVQGRADRRTWADIADELGMNQETVRRWALLSVGAEGATVLAPVEVVQVPAPATVAFPGSLSLLSPSGYRVDGLDVASAAALLRALP
jgi:transposase-like protein